MADHIYLQCSRNPSHFWNSYKNEVKRLVNYSFEMEGENVAEAGKALLLAIHLTDHITKHCPRNEYKYMTRNIGYMKRYLVIKEKVKVAQDLLANEAKQKKERELMERENFQLNINFKPLRPITEPILALMEKLRERVVVNVGNVSMSNVIGLDREKNKLKSIISCQLQFPYENRNVFAKGCLLFGPPGTGKSLLAQVMAAETRMTFFSVSGSALLSKYMGESEQNITALFTLAEVMRPTLIFMDEVDSLCTTRKDGDQTEGSGRRSIVNQLLIETQGTDGVFLMGATNKPSQIDSAFLRRFERKFYIPLPTLSDRFNVLAHYLNEMGSHTLLEADIRHIAKQIKLFSPDDIRQLVGKAYQERLELLDQAKEYFVKIRDDENPPGCKYEWAMSSMHFPNSIKVQSCPPKFTILPPPVTLLTMEDALDGAKPTSSADDIVYFDEFNREHGEFSAIESQS